MTKILVDTSIIIDFLRRKDRESTLFFNLANDKYELYASIITHTECYAGRNIWESKSAMAELKILLGGIKILPLQENISKKAGEINAKSGTDILDAIIAATSIIHDLELATLNIKDFEKVDGIKLFKN